MSNMKWLLITAILVHNSVGEFHNTLLQAVKDVNTTDKCTDALSLYVKNLLSPDDPWALRMFDATSKIPVGLLFTYNFADIGEFNQCVETESNDGLIKGKYCLGSLSLGNMTVTNSDLRAFEQYILVKKASTALTGGLQTRNGHAIQLTGPAWAICLPSECTDEDMFEIMSNLIGSTMAACQTKEDLYPPLTTDAIIAITILSVFAFLLVASTIYDLSCVYTNSEPRHELLVAFSVNKNGKKLFRISKNASSELSCLNGIRFISMIWVIIGHVYSVHANSFPMSNFKDILTFVNSAYSMTIVSGTLSVDSFFLIGGALLVYSFMKAKYKGVRFNIFQFYLHRYLRLTPPLAAVVLVSATLLNYMGTGPYWGNVDIALQQPCKKYWWAALLYIQNYVDTDQDFCIIQTWYLNIDMQLYVLSPLILIPLWKYSKITIPIVIGCILASIAGPFYIAYDLELSALLSNLNTKGDALDFMYYYYTKTHTRAAPWLIGLLLGYVLAQLRFQPASIRKPKMGKVTQKVLLTITWIICLAVLFTCIYAGHGALTGTEYDRLSNSFHIGFVKPVWSLCLAWLIYACVTGSGGPINWLLSLPIYQVLNRFTYSTYLLHLTILYMIGFSSKRGSYFSDFNMAFFFWGIYMFTFGLSVIWVLAFESPVVVLEKIIFKDGKKRVKKVGQDNKGAVP